MARTNTVDERLEELEQKLERARKDPRIGQLVKAAGKGDVATVKRLLAAGADPNAPAPNPNVLETPVWAAVLRRKPQVIQLLADAGADLNTGFPYTPLVVAAEWGNLELLRALIAGGADVNRADRSDQTPLLMAVGEGKAAIVEELLKAGADPNFVAKKRNYEVITNYSPIEYATITGRKAITKLLVAAGGGGKTLPAMLMCTAAGKGDLATVRKSLEKDRVNINCHDAQHKTPLICAAIQGRSKVVRYLIDQGADVNLPAGPKSNKESPLIAAALSGKVEVVKLLVDAGANLDYTPKNYKDGTALAHAKGERRRDVVKYLLEVQKTRGQPQPSTAARGVSTFDTNDAAFVIATDVESAAGAFAKLIGAGVWKKNVLGKKVKLTNRCYALWKLIGTPWTAVIKLAGHWPDIKDAVALSTSLKTRALYVGNSDTAGVTQYFLFDHGQLVEMFAYGTTPDNANAQTVIKQFATAYDVDLSKFPDLSVKKCMVFASARRKLDLATIKNDLDFVNDYVSGQDAYIFFAEADWGEAGQRIELTLEGLGPDDIERLDYVAVE